MKKLKKREVAKVRVESKSSVIPDLTTMLQAAH